MSELERLEFRAELEKLWFLQARLFASSIRREIRKAQKDIERERPAMLATHSERLRSMIESLQLHLDRGKEI